MKVLSDFGADVKFKEDNGVCTIACEDIPQEALYIDIKSDVLNATTGDDGYYVIADAEHKGSRLCRFTSKKDGERCYKQDSMPIFGVKNKNGVFLFIVTGLASEFHIVYGVKDGNYYIYPRFMFNEGRPYEDIQLKMIRLDDNATYSDIAVAYRNYQLDHKNCVPISERAKSNKYLDYAVKAPEIRIRLGWKPAPPPIFEQTPENEPEMKVACTFERVKDIVDELKKQGVDKAEICLVGWNKSGHDGRYPQLFPVEERLGGKEKLMELVEYAKSNGYQIVCHTNSTDCYNVAEDFSEDIVVKKPNGELSKNAGVWSGGRTYHLCPTKSLEFANRDLPKVKELGFEGLHYVDVMTVVPLRWCHDKNHPVNPKQTLKCYESIMESCHKLFGGFASEGVFDFAAKYLDYGFYVSFGAVADDMQDEEIPLWQIVYHGIIMYNPTTDTVNYPIKEPKSRLKVVEYGGRPSFYFYSHFLEGSENEDWLGKEDMICNTDEDLKYSVSKIKEAYDEYKELYRLQTLFIDKHEKKDKNVFEVTYSDGTVVTVDYETGTYKVNANNG